MLFQLEPCHANVLNLFFHVVPMIKHSIKKDTGRNYETVRTGRSSHGWLGDFFWSSQFARVVQALFGLNLDTQEVFFRFEN